MAGIPLNTFRTVPFVVTETDTQVYAAPLGTTAIILMAQVANIGTNYQSVTFKHYQYSTGVITEVVKGFIVPPNDAVNLLSGKLVLETSDRIYVSGSTTTDLKFIASILESANQ